MTEEEKYIKMRLRKAAMQSIPFYLCRVLPIKRKKIVFTTIEGTTGYTCNPKYIAEEFIKRNKENQDDKYELVWLVNDTSKVFPSEIRVVKNTLWNRARELSTAKFWIDNSRKQLECRKRKGQIYIQTWHAKLGFKPTGLDRGASFSKIAYLVSKHDSDMVDYWLSNSDWYDKTLKTGSLYEGKVLRTGSPRCDILVKAKEDKKYKEQIKKNICELYRINSNSEEVHFMMYAPTFREGSKDGRRIIDKNNQFPDFVMLKEALEKKFGGKWYIMMRLHPQLVARGIGCDNKLDFILDGSIKDDMYELLAGCDAFMTDYSSAAFDAMVMEIPLFLFCSDYDEYEKSRGSLLWDLRDEVFSLSENNNELENSIKLYDVLNYRGLIKKLFGDTNVDESGFASKEIVEQLIEFV